MKFDIDKFVESFIQTHFSPFTINDLLKAAGKPVMRKTIENALDIHPDIYKYKKNTYVSRPGYFTGREFSIAPLLSEINAGILIIGHRCMPFIDPEMTLEELLFTHKGVLIPKKSVLLKTQELFDRYSLFGEEYAPHFFSQDPANENLEISEIGYVLPSALYVTVLDMRGLYKSWNFSSGDRLVVKITCWKTGELELEPVFSREEKTAIGGSEDEGRRTWFDLFENSLLAVIDGEGPCESIEEQLARAYFIGGEELFGKNSASAEEFLNYTRKIGIEEYGVETRLWKIGEEIPLCGFLEDEKTMTMLQFFLGGRSFPSIETVLDSYLYDSLYKKEETLFPIVQRMSVPDSLIPKRLFDDFLLHLEARRDILNENYNWFADFEKGKLRSGALELFSQVFDFICQLDTADIPLRKLPQQPLIVLMQLHGHMLYIMESVVPEETLSEKDLSTLYLSLEGMIESFEDVKEDLTEALENNTKQKFSVVSEPKNI